MLDKLLGRRNPPTAIIAPPEPVLSDYSAFPQQTFRREVPVRHESPPLPVQYTTFAGIGRDSGHQGNEHDYFQSLAFSEWLGVMGWPYGVKRAPAPLAIAMNTATDVHPIQERFDIQTPTPTPAGERSAVTTSPTNLMGSSFMGYVGSPLQKVS